MRHDPSPKYEAVQGIGSFEVRFADGRRSVYFYFD
jgi:hypothetical protein